MPKSATIHARIEPELKDEVDSILRQLGLNATQAITLFYTQKRRVMAWKATQANDQKVLIQTG